MKTQKLFPICAALVVSAFSVSALAQNYLRKDELPTKLRFGSEMTLSSEELVNSYPKDGNVVRVSTDLADELVRKMRLSIEEKYKDSARAPQITLKAQHSHWNRTAFQITYPDGFELTVFPDPGALELNSSPSSVQDIEKNLKRIQEDYFNEGKKLGLAPALFTGSGHIHIEVSKLHPVTVRNFLADYYNATGLSAGALNEDIFNSIGMGEIPEENKKKLRAAFEDFDRASEPRTRDLVNSVLRAYEVPYSLEPEDYRKFRRSTRPSKYFAVSFESFNTIGTIEIRAIRPQASAASYLKLLKLFTARMQFAEQNRLEGRRTPIRELKSLRGNPEAVLADFDRYLSEVGLNLKDYKEFVMPWWQIEGAEFDKYTAKKSLAPKACGAFRAG